MSTEETGTTDRAVHRRSDRGMRRRSVLKVAAGAAAIGGLGSATSVVHADSPDARLVKPGSYDVIVIGAGYAGVTAARELRARGLRPLILEARNRIGGRAFTSTFWGKRIELGANWFSQDQTLVMRELQRYGVSLVPEGLMPQRAVYPNGTGGFENLDAIEAFTHNDSLLTRLFDGTRTYYPRPLEPLYADAQIRAVDGKSLRDRINELNLSARDERWVSSTTSGYSGGNSADGGLTALGAWWALAGHTPEGWHSLIGQVATSGTNDLLKKILADAQAQIVYDSPATSIADDGRTVTVTVRGGITYSARAAVVAVPANVWKDISFRPGLPQMHAEVAKQGSGVPVCRKFFAKVRGDFGHVSANGPEGFPISALFSYHELPNNEQMMIGFSSDATLDLTNKAKVTETVQLMLPQAEIRDIKAHDWGKDPYARGGWALRRPGQLTRHMPAVQQPHGRIAFANDGIASGWVGFIDGAIETGIRAATQTVSRF
ncbi:flavin monoamine oxidase family protein [Streptomyces arboris]|uniref:FAD-dependent oxidoreductase n=1 Tax=Streptomyces arboris TaxID=2600619 RepID=A0A5N5EGU7_9ACTN|nr:NAD(P)/FAD-dependent oxidoreductase [Streptomyces arboris]KAB2587832.1 FAD-dependent oxidoreductase [Streptomyces arboris]